MAETEIKSINGKTLADVTAREKKLDKNQGADNAGKILGIGEDGNVTPQDKPAYTLPQATSTALGGVKASEKTNEMTQQVGVDEEGILWTTKTPNVAKWALADLPFTGNEISDTLSGASEYYLLRWL